MNRVRSWGLYVPSLRGCPLMRVSLAVVIVYLSFCFGAVADSVQGVNAPFQLPNPLRSVHLPEAHGSHPDYQTEWWYYTGQLVEEGHDLFSEPALFGFQLTFFRRALFSKGADWDQFYFAHGALSDCSSNSFVHDSRAARGGFGVAGALLDRLQVWNHDWRLTRSGKTHTLEYSLPGNIQLRLRAAEIEPVFHGNGGFSRKGECDRCVSYYYSLPGMDITGEVIRAGGSTKVHGYAWMDHEWMSDAFEGQVVGWDWVSLVLKDQRKVMLFRVRRKEKSPYYSGTLIDEHGARPLSAHEFSIQEERYWKSPHTGAIYPASWRIKVLNGAIDERMVPRLADQEIVSSDTKGHTYWEGAVRSDSGNAIGYVELTGYDKPLGGTL